MLSADGSCWASWHGPAAVPGSPALFVDRDNFLVRDPGFLHRPEDLVLLPGAAQLVRLANRSAWPVILVSNQSGIGRGLFGWEAFHAVQAALGVMLAAHGARFDATLACAAIPDPAPHPWRKPAPGMLLACRSRFGIDLARSYLGGDRLSDLRAARAAGLAGALWIHSGLGRPRRRCSADGFRLWTGSDLPEMVARLERAASVCTLQREAA